MSRLFFLIAAAFLALAPVVAAADSPPSVNGATTVTAAEAYALFEQGAAFIDGRTSSDFATGRIPGAVNLDQASSFTQASLAAVVAKADPVVFYCNGRSCLRSSEESALAVSWGYTAVHYMRDGYSAWEAAGYPIE